MTFNCFSTHLKHTHWQSAPGASVMYHCHSEGASLRNPPSLTIHQFTN